MTVLKRWRYVGVYGPDLMCCFGTVAIGPLRQAFWAVWDRDAKTLHERTRMRPGTVRLAPGRVQVRDRGVAIDLCLDEHAATAIEVTTRQDDGAEVWTRKRIVDAAGWVVLAGVARPLRARGIVDDSAGRHPRHTAWCWSAGVGVAAGDVPVAWNLVSGVHDAAAGSERAVWTGGMPAEVAPVRFADDLTTVEALDGSLALRCAAEAVRARTDNLLGILRSEYEQPFGTFTGTLPGEIALQEGYGVMERHDAHW